METNKRYRLLKSFNNSTPAGTIGFYEIGGDCYLFNGNIFPISFVEDCPEWFEVLKEQSLHNKPILFTTEDGVDIREGDRFSAVQRGMYHALYNIKHSLSNPDKWVTFSTKELAKEYIVNNKPCLSLVDIAIGIDIDKLRQIEDKVKQRLFPNT